MAKTTIDIAEKQLARGKKVSGELFNAIRARMAQSASELDMEVSAILALLVGGMTLEQGAGCINKLALLPRQVDDAEFPLWIGEVRRALRLTQGEFAQRIGKPQSEVSRVECGKGKGRISRDSLLGVRESTLQLIREEALLPEEVLAAFQ